MKRVFIVHGWGSGIKKEWFPYLKKELEKRKFKVFVLKMPNPAKPNIKKWTEYLNKSVGKVDDETYFIGHSIGCQTIIRYLENLEKKDKIGGGVFVAGWFDLKPAAYETEEDKKIAEPWIKLPIDFKKVKSHLGKTIAIFSDDDPYVSLKNSEVFKKKLGAKVIIEKGKGHFSEEDDIFELPVALKSLLEISK